SMPLRGAHLKTPTRLDSVVHISHILAPTEVDHYQIRRNVDVYASPSGEDLSQLYASVQNIIARTKAPERSTTGLGPAQPFFTWTNGQWEAGNTTINVRGSVQAMRESFRSFA